MAAEELQRRAISGSFWTVLHTIVSVPLAFVVNAVVARVLGPADYGDLAILTLALSLAGTVAGLGVADATIQWGAAASARGDRHEVGELLRKNLGLHLLIQLPVTIAVVLVLGREAGMTAALVLIASMTLGTALSSAAMLFGIENRTAAGAKIAMASNSVVQVSVLLSAVVTASPAWVWAVRNLAGSLLLPFNFLVLDRWGRRAARRIGLPRGFPPGFWRFALLSMAAGLIGLLVFSRSEILYLRYFGSPEAVGLFALAFGVAAHITAPVDALMGPLMPAIAGLVSSHPKAVRRGRERALRASSFLAGGVLGAVVPVFVVALPLIYGEAYRAAQPVFLVLAATSCLQSVCNPLLAFVNARREAGRLLRINLVALVANTALAISLIPVLGLYGALISNVVAQLVVLGLLVMMEAGREDEPLAPFLRGMLAWLVGLIAAVTAVAVPLVLGLSTAAALAFAAVVGPALYVVGVRATDSGMLDADWLAIADALPTKLARPVALAGRIFGA